MGSPQLIKLNKRDLLALIKKLKSLWSAAKTSCKRSKLHFFFQAINFFVAFMLIVVLAPKGVEAAVDRLVGETSSTEGVLLKLIFSSIAVLILLKIFYINFKYFLKTVISETLMLTAIAIEVVLISSGIADKNNPRNR